MKKKTVLIDMDGVICDYPQKMLNLATERFGLPHYQAKDVAEFYTERIFPAQYQTAIDALSLEEDFFEDLDPLPGAIGAIREMIADPRLDVWVCSSPKKVSIFCHSEKFRWLRLYFGQELAERLILTRDKTLVFGDYLIDDKPIIVGVNQNPAWEHLIFDQPYNRSIKDKRRIDWSNWKSVLDKH